MNTALQILSNHRGSLAWPAAMLRHWLARARPRPQPEDRLDGLADLDARTLRDIGAPERLVAHSLTRREDEQRRRDELAVGFVAGAWRHW